MSRVAVKENVLRWAIERSGVNVQYLLDKFPKMQDWTSGHDQPTLRQLESFAKATRTPLGFLFLETPPIESLPIPHFRTTNDRTGARPSPDLIETIQTIQLRQSWLREYLIDQEYGKLEFVGFADIKEEPFGVAKRLKEALRLEDQWASRRPTWTDALRYLREAMENAGIVVVVNGIVGNNTHRKLDVDEFRGFVLVDEYAPFLFVNGADGEAAQMFTLAHELAHVAYGSSAAFDLRRLLPAEDRTERACNALAAEFLVPEQKLRQLWKSLSHRSGRFELLAREFKVSTIVAARRALDLNLIDIRDFIRFYEAYLEEIHMPVNRASSGDFYAVQNLRIGRPFALAAVRAAREGKLLYHDAYRLTGLHGNTFERFANVLLGEQSHG